MSASRALRLKLVLGHAAAGFPVGISPMDAARPFCSSSAFCLATSLCLSAGVCPDPLAADPLATAGASVSMAPSISIALRVIHQVAFPWPPRTADGLLRTRRASSRIASGTRSCAWPRTCHPCKLGTLGTSRTGHGHRCLRLAPLPAGVPLRPRALVRRWASRTAPPGLSWRTPRACAGSSPASAVPECP